MGEARKRFRGGETKEGTLFQRLCASDASRDQRSLLAKSLKY